MKSVLDKLKMEEDRLNKELEDSHGSQEVKFKRTLFTLGG
jgi:type III secretory pathway component EscU